MPPIYLYENEDTKEVVEIFQTMKERHEYFGKNGKEKNWKRVYINPHVSFDSIIKDPFNSKEFANKGANKKGTLGDWYSESEELSAKRAEKYGKDPVKEEYYKNYSKNRKGKKHYLQQKEETAKELDKIGVILTD